MPKHKRCVYCGSQTELTTDHVPPACLFPRPRPSHLITVPACRICNEGASKDDEYFRLVVSLESNAGDHPDAQKNWAPIFRSLQNPKQKHLSASFLRTTFPVERRTTTGLFVGRGLAYKVDLARLDRVASRIVKGLFYHKRAELLPESHLVIAWSESGLQQEAIHELEQFRTTVVTPLMNTKKGEKKGDILLLSVGWKGRTRLEKKK